MTRARGGMRRGSTAKGCLIAAGVAVVLAVAVVVTVMLVWKKVAGAAMSAVAVQVVNDSSLPTEQKTAITTRIEGVVQDWKDGKVTGDQLGRVVKEIAEGPVLPLAMVGLAERMYVEPSALSVEEKAGASRSLQRFARGVFEKKIPKSAAEQVLDSVSVRGPGNGRQLKQTLTPEELAAFLALVKGHADQAQIPDEAFEIDYAAEVNTAIDRALAGG
jgi:hypothetical protein